MVCKTPLCLLLISVTGIYSLRFSEFIGGSSDGWRAIAGLPSVISIDGNGVAHLAVNRSTSPSFYLAPNELVMDIIYRASQNDSDNSVSLRVVLDFPSTCNGSCSSRLIIVGETCSLDIPLSRGENFVQLWPYRNLEGSTWSLCSVLLEPDHLCEEKDPANATSKTLRTLRFLLISIDTQSAAYPADFSLSAAELLPALSCPTAQDEPPCDGALSSRVGIADWLVLADFPPLEACTMPPVHQPGT
jgi:hypothetical protein